MGQLSFGYAATCTTIAMDHWDGIDLPNAYSNSASHFIPPAAVETSRFIQVRRGRKRQYLRDDPQKKRTADHARIDFTTTTDYASAEFILTRRMPSLHHQPGARLGQIPRNWPLTPKPPSPRLAGSVWAEQTVHRSFLIFLPPSD
jgi:hypothetical protein